MSCYPVPRRCRRRPTATIEHENRELCRYQASRHAPDRNRWDRPACLCMGARRAGTELTPLLKKAGLTDQQIQDRGARLAVHRQIQFLNAVANVLGDESLGFHLAQLPDLRELGLLFYVAASSETRNFRPGTVFESGNAGPDDLVIIAHAFSSIRDCDNALVWVERANEAFQAAGREPDESLHRMRMRCGSDNHRKDTPQLDADATKSKLGDRFVRIGELYYGFGEYQHAIIAIQRGLEIGRVSHLDDAYVYLGLSELALKNAREACKAFDKLENVPDINPRTLRLWKLFADTHC
jgi:tetratricopeptide (TPR) repeat protein